MAASLDVRTLRVRVPNNVAALLILWASLMRFFSLFKPGPKKCPAQIMRFFFGGGVLGGCCSCVLMVNLKAATT